MRRHIARAVLSQRLARNAGDVHIEQPRDCACAGPCLSDAALDCLHDALSRVLEHRPPNPVAHIAAHLEAAVKPCTGVKAAARELGITTPASRQFASQAARAYQHLQADSLRPYRGHVSLEVVHELLSMLNKRACKLPPQDASDAASDGHVKFPAFLSLVKHGLRSVTEEQSVARIAAASPVSPHVAMGDADSGPPLVPIILPCMLMQPAEVSSQL